MTWRLVHELSAARASSAILVLAIGLLVVPFRCPQQTELTVKPISPEPGAPFATSVEQSQSSRWAVGALALSMLLSSLGVSVANVALPILAQAFDASFQAVQWVVLSYLLAITTAIVSVGKLGDVLGHRRLLLAGLVLFTTASLLCGLAPNLTLLIAARALQGLGAAVLMALTVAFVGQTVPQNKIGAAMGLLGTMSAVGTALGPTLGGVLIAGPGWRALFFVMVPVGLAAFVISGRYLPAAKIPQKGDDTGFDGWGTVVLAITLAAYALAMTVGRGQFGGLNAALLAAAAIGIGVFGVVQARVASPLIHVALLRDRQLRAALAMNALISTVIMATLVVGPFYLSGALGLDAVGVGFVLSIGPIISAFSGVPAGRIVDRLGARRTVIVGSLLMVVGCLALSALPAVLGLAGYIAAIVVLTPGYQLLQAANNTAVMMGVPANQRGVISGLLSLSRNLGLITGASLMGAVFSVAGMQVTFALATILMLFALTFAIRVRAATK
jgi:EmrB/QacA subfamily drug resistance transporter